MAKAMGLIFSLFDIASAQEVCFGMLQYVQYILHTQVSPSFVFYIMNVITKKKNPKLNTTYHVP